MGNEPTATKSQTRLKVTEVKEVKTIGDKGAKKLPFKAAGPDGKEAWYFTWKTDLFPSITAGAELIADVEVSQREVDGNIYTDRKLTQSYSPEGTPLSAGKTAGYNVGRSLEATKFEAEMRAAQNRSIEFQVALKEAGECLRNGKAPPAIEAAYWKALERLLTAVPIIAATPAVTSPAPANGQPAAAVTVESLGKTDTTGTLPPPKNVGEILNRAWIHKIQKAQLLDVWGVKDTAAVTDIPSAWAKAIAAFPVLATASVK